jgi:hypothetical protein
VKDSYSALLNFKHQGMPSMKCLQQEDTTKAAYIDTDLISEELGQLELYNYSRWHIRLIHRLAYNYASFYRKGSVQGKLKGMRKYYRMLLGDDMKQSNLAELCIVPLPHFNSYRTLPGDRGFLYGEETETEAHLFKVVKYYEYSLFSLIALNIHGNTIFRQGNTVIDILISYKWKKFARSRFYFILFCHSVYYVAYSTSVSFPEELFGYVPGTPLTHLSHLMTIIIMFLFGFILFVQEYRQFALNRLEYFRSFYNYFDLAAFSLPVATFILLRTGSGFLVS